jgi:hypothetical protein
MRFLRSDDVINDKLVVLSMNCLEAKTLTNTYKMIKVVRMAGAK